MPPFPSLRLIVLIVLAALTAASTFYVLTTPDPAPPRTDPCPPPRPVRLEAGPCVPERYLETTAHRGGGER